MCNQKCDSFTRSPLPPTINLSPSTSIFGKNPAIINIFLTEHLKNQAARVEWGTRGPIDLLKMICVATDYKLQFSWWGLYINHYRISHLNEYPLPPPPSPPLPSPPEISIVFVNKHFSEMPWKPHSPGDEHARIKWMEKSGGGKNKEGRSSNFSSSLTHFFTFLCTLPTGGFIPLLHCWYTYK